MREVFQAVLNLSINASWLILAVLLLRALLWKAPKGLRYVLWALVGIRLICPFTVESAFSLVPSQETIKEGMISPGYMEQNGEVLGNPDGLVDVETNQNNGTIIIEKPLNPGENHPNTDVEQGSSDNSALSSEEFFTVEDLVAALPVVWLTGVVLILFYATVNYMKLRNKVAASVQVEDNLWICDEIQSPFILGILKPRIYMPSYIDRQQKPYILAHEKEHLKYYDNLWKPLGFLILSIHWFNPLVWVSYVLMCRDIEYACDERVIRQMNHEEKKKYTESLLLCSNPRHFISACPVAFGEISIKERIKNVIKYKKPATWMVAIGVVACAIVAVCFMTNQAGKEPDKGTEGTDTEYRYTESVFYETTADLNHDGIEDLVQTVCQTGVDATDTSLNSASVNVVVKVFEGIQKDKYQEECIYVSQEVNSSHGGNGTFVLTEKDGKDYLVYSMMYESMGEAAYDYEVIDFEIGKKNVVARDSVWFSVAPSTYKWETQPHRVDVIPTFKEKFLPWIENGIILISYDIATDTFASTTDKLVPASDYYDLVWARSEEEELADFEASVGPEWKQYFYRRGGIYANSADKIEEVLEQDLSNWFSEYNGSKLQRMESCDNGAVCSSCISANCDIMYYDAELNEDVQSVLYKMIEAMILPRMEASDTRSYTITEYAIKEQPVLKITDHVWFVEYLNGYYKYDGTELGTFEEVMQYEGESAIDGLLPFLRQGSDDAFFYLLIEDDGVYRLEKLHNMM